MTRKIKILLRSFTAFIAVAIMFSSVPAVSAVQKRTADDFVHAEGRYIIGTDGKKLEIRGMALGNSVWSSPVTPNLKHHTENTYKELSKMGFNCVRFYLNYEMFESDEKPYSYKKAGFEWIDKNIKWAKKYNMGIILNMHCPQGGYQSQGNGMALWTDKSNQKRLAALWKKIAQRYANESTIWGYGLVNEPFAAMLDTQEETLERYETLVKNITKEIRKVSPYQMIFVERLGGAKDVEGERQTEWYDFSSEASFPIINDSNVVYEFHFYEPMQFTHQNSEWAGTEGVTMTYPSDDIISADYENGWVGCISAQKKRNSGEWGYFESAPLTLSAERNIGFAAVNASNSGRNGAVYFDDITVTEISADGKKSVKYTYSFDDDSDGVFYSWSADGSGKMIIVENEGRSGSALKISGAMSDFTASASNRFELKKGCKYIVSGYIRTENTSCKPTVRLDYAKASDIRIFNKKSLEMAMKPYAEFSKEHNVPVYLGEFGVVREGFEEGRNGADWVSDMIDICRKYDVGFNYHTYHEAAFGFYFSSDNVLPNKKDRNEELAKVFRTKFKNA